MGKEIVTIIILLWKDMELLAPLLSTIQEDNIDINMLVLDNESSDKSWQYLNSLNDYRLTLIKSKTNLGYTGGINYAVEYGFKNIENFKYFFIINPDAKCTPNLIGNLFRMLKSDKDIACISPKILSEDKCVTYSGGKIDYRKGVVTHIVMTDEYYPEPSYETDSYHGCAVLFDAEKFKSVGMMNEDIFIYYDETDLSIKFKQNNYKILYAPALLVFHDTSYTMRKISFLKTYYMTRNKLMVFHRTMSLYNKVYFLLYELRYHLKNKRIKNAVYHLKGYYHYLQGKKGSYFNL